ncbi:PspA/IM30 family protein [Phormidium sp. LEGE 05292]|uniref:PspA/IM30 family protein n=1 Tax=[Phormidium] sp. LEGE 05292 TaxID=767427 RepID=UPI0018823265|nr:PspA/IM30 family protein [Phormidium sp. LEGE 05292]MBE9229721.1 PspA/IM30 family protein [Phormidium sp. LEGE 05292]
MGLIDRIVRVIRANVNDLINKTEDPEKILEQTVLEMQDNLIQLRQAVAAAIATKKRTERDVNHAQSHADSWYNRAQLALEKENEQLAREALVKRKSYWETVQALQGQLTSLDTIITKLKQDLRTLEGKIAEARMKKDMYIARARSAQAAAKMNELMDKYNPSGTLQAFERMEEKILQLEARSEVIEKMGSRELENKFAALEMGNDVDAELAQMKQRITGVTEAD